MKCTPSDCKGNCDWRPPALHVKAAAGFPPGSRLENKESGLCIDSGTAPRTCAAGSSSLGTPLCDGGLPFASRAAWLVANLTLQEKLDIFMLTKMRGGIPRLNVKPFGWDSTDIEGVDPQQELSFGYNMTAFPHAIGLGATFDRDLITRVSRATAVEARILESWYFRATGGNLVAATNFDGGPLANVAYDPRVGRISEMYGEDPYHVSQIGTVATLALQNRTPAAHNDYWLQTSQVTRHFITDHGSSPDNGMGDYTGDVRWLEDEYLPPFKAFQLDGQAEGIMWSIASLNNMSSVGNTFLFDKLRTEWGSDCLRQTDCCGTFGKAVERKDFASTEDAVSTAIKLGIQLDYGDSVAADISNAIDAGKLTTSDLDEAVGRAMLVRFRLGEFDEPPANPFFNAYPDAMLDSPAHRQLAREAMSASVVLLQNRGQLLPLNRKGGTSVKQIAVVGPFADCPDRTPGYGGHPCYLHSYNGQPSYISTILAAIQEAAAATGATVTFAPGGPFVGESNATAIAQAVSAALGAEVTILALGLGDKVESEGLDRSYLTLPTPQLDLLTNVTAALAVDPSKRSVLAVNSAGGVDLDVTSVDAIVQAWYGGQETGHGLADVLFGRVAPSGRLPLTVHPSSYLEGVGPVPNLNMVFPHGVSSQGRTYRYLANHSRDALFSFGWGLSYTKFSYSSLRVTCNPAGAPQKIALSVTVNNTGVIDASEVVQVYITVPRGSLQPPPPQFALAYFDKVHIAAGAGATVSTTLDASALSVAQQDGSRRVVGGSYTLSAAGHYPADPRAALPANAPFASNTVSASCTMEV